MKRTIQPKKVTYNVDEEPIVLSKQLLDLFLKQDKFADLVALYVFYYYTAKWQGTNQPKATTAYVSNGIGWGVDKVTNTKEKLKKMGLVEDVIRRNSNGKIIAHYVQINFSSTLTSAGILPGVVKHPYKYLYIGNNNIKEKNKIPPSIEMVKTYCDERKNGVDPLAFIDFYESKGWMIGKNRMKDWQASVRTWEKNRKDLKEKKTFIIDDGRKYELCPDGLYRNKAGEIYIE